MTQDSLAERVAGRFKSARPASQFLKTYFDRCFLANRSEIERRVKEWGVDAGADLARENPQKNEQELLVLAGQPEITWERYLDDKILVQDVQSVLDPIMNRVDVSFSTEDSFVDVTGIEIEMLSKAYGASYSINPSDPYDFVEAPAMEDDHSRTIEKALKATGASVRVTTKIEKDPRYSDLQNVVFEIRAVWDFRSLQDYVPAGLIKLYEEAVKSGIQSARSAEA